MMRMRPPAAKGMATLTVVMVMFFVMAMVAAYTNRNLIFEQRTSANSYHSAQALAAADAGVDWAIGMLNGGTIDTTCIGALGGDDFRTRYLNLEYDGSYSVKSWMGPSGLASPSPSCVMTDVGWSCSCPVGPSASLVASTDVSPSVFRVSILSKPSTYDPKQYPGTLKLEIRGCTSAISGQGVDVNDSLACHMTTGTAKVDGQSKVWVSLGLVSALPVPPAATLTAGGQITLAATATVLASNTDPNTSAVLHAGGSINKLGAWQFSGPPGGGATDLELPNDSDMSALAGNADEFFRSFFGMLPPSYRQQPSALRLACAAGCSASAHLAPALAANPTRVIWIDGDLNIDQNLTLGSTALPAIVVVTGTVTFSQPATFNGVIYSAGDMTWQSSAAGGVVVGALVTRQNFVANGSATMVYDREMIRRIHQIYGSFVRVPGSWRIAL